MKYDLFFKRAIAEIIDYILIIVCFINVLMISTPVIEKIISNTYYEQVSGFLLILVMSIYPLNMVLSVIFSYTHVDFFMVMLFFIIETFYYSVQELLGMKRTLGFMLTRIKIEYQGEKNRVGRILLRNSLKTLSRYLYGLPMLTMFLSKKNQTFYDILSGAVFYEVENEK